jgi:hypothetical protein
MYVPWIPGSGTRMITDLDHVEAKVARKCKKKEKRALRAREACDAYIWRYPWRKGGQWTASDALRSVDCTFRSAMSSSLDGAKNGCDWGREVDGDR